MGDGLPLSDEGGDQAVKAFQLGGQEADASPGGGKEAEVVPVGAFCTVVIFVKRAGAAPITAVADIRRFQDGGAEELVVGAAERSALSLEAVLAVLLACTGRAQALYRAGGPVGAVCYGCLIVGTPLFYKGAVLSDFAGDCGRVPAEDACGLLEAESVFQAGLDGFTLFQR